MKEQEIRPKRLFKKYLDLSKQDINNYFKFQNLKKTKCIACNRKTNFIFKKNNFFFDQCDYCHTLFVNPRPKLKDFENFYKYSKSASYWASHFYKKTEKARRKKIWIPKRDLILTKVNKTNQKTLIDIGGGYGIFASLMKKYFKKIKIIEPNHSLATECKKNKKIDVIEKFFEDVKISDFDNKDEKVYTCFEMIEHLHDVRNFLKKLKKIMKKNDVFIFSTLSSLGFDILALGKNSNSVYPPHHLNFLNPFSTKLLLNNIGFKKIEVITPGELDIDITYNNKKYVNDNFVKLFLKYSTPDAKNNFQNFLKLNNFSSHMMVFCQK